MLRMFKTEPLPKKVRVRQQALNWGKLAEKKDTVLIGHQAIKPTWLVVHLY